MPNTDTNLADRSSHLVEQHKGYDPRIIFFYFVLAALLLILVGGLANEQLVKTAFHDNRERKQNQRRILVPGPRGNIYDRNHQLLVGNRPRFSVVLYLDELKTELFREHDRIHKNYLAALEKKDIPIPADLEKIARVSLAQRYLDQVNAILHRDEKVDAKAVREHFNSELLLPYTLLDDLSPEDYARLLERLPVDSPVQVYSSSTRFYPYGSTAAHTLGYIRAIDGTVADDFGSKDLRTFRMKGTIGRDGLERQFDKLLQGEAGGSIIRVDPTGYKVDSPDLPHRLPVQGKNIETSLDLDLQIAAESSLGDQTGAAVALDVATGEVLVLASKPDYDLSEFSPRVSTETYKAIQEKGAEFNRALSGLYPPGSTFKILTTIAGLRQGAITPDTAIVDCEGTTRIGNSTFSCYNGIGHHGNVLLRDAIAESCDIYFYEAGRLTTVDRLAAEARRFHLDQRTGIELPGETRLMVIPDPAWKQRVHHESWYPGDTAQMAIGQSFLLVSPLGMACFAASVARGEVFTQPNLKHQADRATQHTESIGLTPEQRAALIDGMEGATHPPHGTARTLTTVEAYRVPGVRIAGKTGTAQKGVKPNIVNIAWFICFAPVEKPEIAIAVAIEGDTPGEEFGGGLHAAPVASAILQKYFEKKRGPVAPLFPAVTPK